jgi:hypothetical protein
MGPCRSSPPRRSTFLPANVLALADEVIESGFGDFRCWHETDMRKWSLHVGYKRECQQSLYGFAGDYSEAAQLTRAEVEIYGYGVNPKIQKFRLVGGRPLWCAFRTQVGLRVRSEKCQ